MTDQVALLRGINVGGHRVKMDRLRALFEDMGFDDVETFIASGNVIFSAAPIGESALAARIRAHLTGALGYDVPTLIRSPEELRAVALHQPALDARPGEDSAHWSLYAVFLEEAADDTMRERLTDLQSTMDRFTFAEREIYWSIRGKLSESPLFASMDRAIGRTPSTMRNLTSVRRLVEKLAKRSGGAEG